MCEHGDGVCEPDRGCEIIMGPAEAMGVERFASVTTVADDQTQIRLQVLGHFNVDLNSGLSMQRIEEASLRYGKNELASEPGEQQCRLSTERRRGRQPKACVLTLWLLYLLCRHAILEAGP